MSQKVCICGREKSKEKPLVITINACKNKHPSSENTTATTSKNDGLPPDKDDGATYVSRDHPKSKSPGYLYPISENSSQSLSKLIDKSLAQVSKTETLQISAKGVASKPESTQIDVDKSRTKSLMMESSPSSGKNFKSPSTSDQASIAEPEPSKRTVDKLMSTSKTTSKSLTEEVSTAEKSSNRVQSVLQKSLKSSSSILKTFSDQLGSKRSSEESYSPKKSGSRISPQSSMKRPPTPEKSEDFSQSTVRQSLKSESRTSRTSSEQPNSRMKSSEESHSPKKSGSRISPQSSMKRPPTPEKSEDSSQSTVRQSLKSESRTSRTSSEQPNSRMKNIEETQSPIKAGSKISAKSSIKEAFQKSKDFSQSVFDQVNQSSSPIDGKSLQSLSEVKEKRGTADFDTDRKSGGSSKSNSKTSGSVIMGSSSKSSPKKLSFNEKDDLSMSNTETVKNRSQLDTQSLDVPGESDEEKVTDHILYCEEDNQVRLRRRAQPSEETICGLDGYIDRPSPLRTPHKFLDNPRSEMERNANKKINFNKKDKSAYADFTKFLKKKLQNFPSDASLKLPTLASRYHGPDCAMEINVLEKHGKKCSYKKMKNPDRNPIDDRVGSYDVIGRIMFRTCGVGSSKMDETADTREKSSNLKLTELYSLLHLPGFDKRAFVVSSSSDYRVRPVKKTSNAIVKGSKSFPNHSRDRRAYDMQELYLSSGNTDKSVQMTNGHRKKWYYSLFSCIFDSGGS
nr:uncharacterized protein LOC111516334 [Leptinotarsa decemlineata]